MKQTWDIVFDKKARSYLANYVKEATVNLKKARSIEGKVKVVKGTNGATDIFIGKERLNGDRIVSYFVKKSLRRSRNVK